MLKNTSKILTVFILFTILFCNLNSIFAGLDPVSISVKVENVDNYQYNLYILSSDKKETNYEFHRYANEFKIQYDLETLPTEYYLQIVKGDEVITTEKIYRYKADQNIVLDGNTGEILSNDNSKMIVYKNKVLNILKYVLLLFVLPYILEIIIAFFFGIKKYPLLILISNPLTHAIMYIFMYLTYKSVEYIDIIPYILFAIMCAGIQYIIYRKRIKGCSRKHIFLFNLTSNLFFYVILGYIMYATVLI